MYWPWSLRARRRSGERRRGARDRATPGPAAARSRARRSSSGARRPSAAPAVERDRRIEPIFETIAPGIGDVPRTPGLSGDPSPAEKGYLYCGQAGAGHFVKMVHNGIEYGIMAAFAEGLNILENADAGKSSRDEDAETAPLEQPEYYQYDIDIPEVAEVWRRGSVIGSWLLDLTAAALAESPELKEFSGRVSDSGEGRWTSIAAIEEGVPAPVLTAALYERFSSRGLGDFGDKVMSAMRKQFGGHDEKPATDPGSGEGS